MGYVGEAVVCQWLRHKYPAEDGYEVVSQVRPLGVRATGGSYLDFGVVRGTELIALYEGPAAGQCHRWILNSHFLELKDPTP